MPTSASELQSLARACTPSAVGSAAIAAPLSAPTLVPTTRRGRTPGLRAGRGASLPGWRRARRRRPARWPGWLAMRRQSASSSIRLSAPELSRLRQVCKPSRAGQRWAYFRRKVTAMPKIASAGPKAASSARRTAHYGAWWERAACRSADPEMFFPLSGSGAETLADIARAKAVCRSCAVREQCLDYALDSGQSYGVRGRLAGRMSAGRSVAAGARSARRGPSAGR